MSDPATVAGLIDGMEKVAFGGQNSASATQPPPPQTPDDHRKQTRRKALAIGAGVAALGVGIAGRKHIAKGAKGALEKLKERKEINKIKGAKSWEELGHAKATKSTLDGLGKAPVAGTPIGNEVAKEFKSMGMDPPPFHPTPGHAKSKGRSKLKGAAAGVGLAAGATAMAVPGIAHGASKSLNQQQDDQTPGMRGVR